MKLSSNESIIVETADGHQFRIGVDAECGTSGIKVGSLDGAIFVTHLNKQQLLIKGPMVGGGAGRSVDE